jgi:catechol 2,3-dioxygenase-like lactoylglutathione lyase family enzyme
MKALYALMVATLLMSGCTGDETAREQSASPPDIIATNAFYYYADVDSAWAFYRDTLGLETVVDYGFAKILRLADTSYLTLVQADSGMHSTDEPKTVTLDLVTDTLGPWFEHLSAQGVDMRIGYDADAEVQPNSFVAVDPEGYFLKFIRYNPHPNHDSFVAAFAALDPVSSSAGSGLSIRATAFEAYFSSAIEVSNFYESLFAVSPVGKLDGQVLYQFAKSGFVVLVDGGDELHQPTEENGVTLSFLTTDVDGWFERATGWPGFELRTPEVLNESDLVRVFVGYDPTGIFLEWDTFLDLPENAALMRHLTN